MLNQGYVDNEKTFKDCPLLSAINVSPANIYHTSLDGVLYNKDLTTLVRYPMGKAIPETFYLPESVTNLFSGAFYQHLSVKNVVLPDGVKAISNYCFAYSTLESINLDNIISIGNYSFRFCLLTSVIIHANISSIGMNAFSYNERLESFVIAEGSGITMLRSTVSYCTSLTDVSLPEGVVTLDSTFSDCSSLQSLVIPSTVKTLSSSVFKDCLALATITFKAATAPSANSSNVFGNYISDYTGRNTYDQGTNMLYVPVGATGYDTGYWLDPLCNPDKCGFTISYTL